jgi:hypothetical protein
MSGQGPTWCCHPHVQPFSRFVWVRAVMDRKTHFVKEFSHRAIPTNPPPVPIGTPAGAPFLAAQDGIVVDKLPTGAIKARVVVALADYFVAFAFNRARPSWLACYYVTIRQPLAGGRVLVVATSSNAGAGPVAPVACAHSSFICLLTLDAVSMVYPAASGEVLASTSSGAGALPVAPITFA